jgi:prepilin-type N-terminal cleavage/methylation domain-containing protein
MKKLLSLSYRDQRGFTLIELLIVIAILGIIAAIVVPNVAGFMTSGNLNAANTEVQNVKTAAVGYLAEYGEWPATSTVLENVFLEGAPKATYSFSAAEGEGGQITSASPADWGVGLYWCADSQTWVRNASACSGGGGEGGE